MAHIMRIDEFNAGLTQVTYSGTTQTETEIFFDNPAMLEQFNNFIKFATNEYGFNVQISLLKGTKKFVVVEGKRPNPESDDYAEFTIYIPKGVFSIPELLYNYEEQDEDNLQPVVDEMADVFAEKYNA